MNRNPLNWLRLAQPHQTCRHCHAFTISGGLCAPCQNALQDTRLRCFRCALPLNDPAGICGECIANPPAFEQTVCADSYRPPVSHWLQNFKDSRDLRDGHLLSQRLIQRVKSLYCTDDLPHYLIPVPLHWRRALWRNFNQSSWIARQLSKELHIPALQCLHRTRPGGDQRHLSRQDRLRNLRGVFKLADDPAMRQQLQQRHVAVIDDVITTTATARAISSELRRQGAARVDIWSLARTDKTHLSD
ncbi:ComF family protein [Aestuariicella sp. G3-2]|uniref:ComF family protein n=1 Tax=Pseudomaricurvus albidus TaxID=2842452 RepID=UPI001C0D0820|nr:ComF family protein [Aestuariicella albida]MBU3069358.1 ComF family protein [Aestuariicella albida]